MKYVRLKDESDRRLSFYLAMEEYVARHIKERECFFMWQVEPSVIFGRNQLIENEVNLPYCQENNIGIYRRKSGGGCVYADKSNIMMAYITDDMNVRFTFDRYLHQMAFVLRKLGVKAEVSGRNDILVEGRKISGNAFYHIPGKSVVHGTMLFNTDMERLVRAITPSGEKLISKGVESVRQRVTNLSEYTDISIEDFKTHVRTMLCEDEIVLTPQQVAEIEQLEQEYLSDAFLYGNNPRYTLVKRMRTASAGEVELRMELKNGIIKHLIILGDYFPVGDVDSQLMIRLNGVPATREAIEKALAPVQMEEVILNLTKEEFIDLLTTD